MTGGHLEPADAARALHDGVQQTLVVAALELIAAEAGVTSLEVAVRSALAHLRTAQDQVGQVIEGLEAAASHCHDDTP